MQDSFSMGPEEAFIHHLIRKVSAPNTEPTKSASESVTLKITSLVGIFTPSQR